MTDCPNGSVLDRLELPHDPNKGQGLHKAGHGTWHSLGLATGAKKDPVDHCEAVSERELADGRELR